MNESWSHQRERGSILLMRFISWLSLSVGRNAGRLLLPPICLYFLLFSVRARRASRDFLLKVFEKPPSWPQIFRHYHTFASTILDRTLLVSGYHRAFDLDVRGHEVFEELLRKGEGALLLGSHLGSFEIVRAYGVLENKIEVKILMYEENAQKLNRVFKTLNPDIASSIVPIGSPESLLKVREYVKGGAFVGILGDRIFSEQKSITCEFLGQETRFPTGPLLLAASLRVPVILFFGLYQGGNRYRIHFELFAEEIDLHRQDREQLLRLWTERYVQRLEHYCRKAPFNWFNFYDFWNA